MLILLTPTLACALCCAGSEENDVRCIVLAAWKRRLLSLIVLVLACASTAPARAADARVEKEAKALQKKAIEEDNLNVNYAAAVKKLNFRAVSDIVGARSALGK